MSDFNYGGTEEESAEIKKLNAEVVSFLFYTYALASQYCVFNANTFCVSSRIPITLRTGRSLSAPQRLSRVG